MFFVEKQMVLVHPIPYPYHPCMVYHGSYGILRFRPPKPLRNGINKKSANMAAGLAGLAWNAAQCLWMKRCQLCILRFLEINKTAVRIQTNISATNRYIRVSEPVSLIPYFCSHRFPDIRPPIRKTSTHRSPMDNPSQFLPRHTKTNKSRPSLWFALPLFGFQCQKKSNRNPTSHHKHWDE